MAAKFADFVLVSATIMVTAFPAIGGGLSVARTGLPSIAYGLGVGFYVSAHDPILPWTPLV